MTGHLDIKDALWTADIAVSNSRCRDPPSPIHGGVLVSAILNHEISIEQNGIYELQHVDNFLKKALTIQVNSISML